jgi:hypothetical protein
VRGLESQRSSTSASFADEVARRRRPSSISASERAVLSAALRIARPVESSDALDVAAMTIEERNRLKREILRQHPQLAEQLRDAIAAD